MLLVLLVLLASSIYLAKQLAFTTSLGRRKLLTVVAVGTTIGTITMFWLADNKADYVLIAMGGLAVGVLGAALIVPFIRARDGW